MQELKNKRIIQVRRNDDYTSLCFDTDSGSIAYSAIGDCCSHSWFNHLNGLETLVGSLVTEVEELPEVSARRDDPIPEWGSYDDAIVVYGWRIQTDRGTVEIEMRNSSNGYYGGAAELDLGPSDAAHLVTEDF